MSITPEDFKNTLRYYPSGVAIVSIKAGNEQHAITVSAFASVSAEPPLISVFVNNHGSSHSLLQRDDAVFAVNMLTAEQVELANRFAFSKEDRFAMGDWATAVTGAPVLENGLAWLDCTIYARHTAGSHTIYVGEIQQTKIIQPEAQPLLYWNRDYRQVTDIAEKVTTL